MTSIFKNEFIKVLKDAETGILKAVWNDKALLHQNFKESVTAFSDLVLKFESKLILVDARLHKYTLSTDVQNWHDAEIAPKYIKAKVKKIAFIQQASLFSELTTKKVFESEKTIEAMKNGFFKTEAEALEWLNN